MQKIMFSVHFMHCNQFLLSMICKIAFHVAWAVQETSSSEIFGGQSDDFLRRDCNLETPIFRFALPGNLPKHMCWICLVYPVPFWDGSNVASSQATPCSTGHRQVLGKRFLASMSKTSSLGRKHGSFWSWKLPLESDLVMDDMQWVMI